MRRVPKGEIRPMAVVRSDLAQREAADAACPVTSSIHTRIVAEMAIEAMNAGVPADAVPPFWRVIDPKSDLAKKLSIGPEGIERLQGAERG
jgi:mRNA-degrading endonuclease toxin of MazEF toxin-antitoxin module